MNHVCTFLSKFFPVLEGFSRIDLLLWSCVVQLEQWVCRLAWKTNWVQSYSGRSVDVNCCLSVFSLKIIWLCLAQFGSVLGEGPNICILDWVWYWSFSEQRLNECMMGERLIPINMLTSWPWQCWYSGSLRRFVSCLVLSSFSLFSEFVAIQSLQFLA